MRGKPPKKLKLNNNHVNAPRGDVLPRGLTLPTALMLLPRKGMPPWLNVIV